MARRIVRRLTPEEREEQAHKEWASYGIERLGDYLAKQARFDEYLRTRRPAEEKEK